MEYLPDSLRNNCSLNVFKDTLKLFLIDSDYCGLFFFFTKFTAIFLLLQFDIYVTQSMYAT